MAYINFRKAQVYVLNGFEAAALVNEYLRLIGEDGFGETGLDDAIEYGTGTLLCPLTDDVFGSWSIEPCCFNMRYQVDDLADERYSLYYFEIGDDTNSAAMRALTMFGERWLKRREYTLRYTLQ
jgi:hypothetical protein